MSLGQQLPTALRRVADTHEPPVPDLASITAGGQRRRRARNVRRVVAVAAGVAVVVTIAFLVRPDVSPSEAPTQEPSETLAVTDLPTGGPPQIPYCTAHGTIRGAGAPIDARCDVMVARGGTALYLSPHGVSRLEDGRNTLLDSRPPSYWFPALSLDGRWAAWVSRSTDEPTDAVLLAFDLQSGTRVEVRWRTANGWVAGIDDFGRVYFEDFTRSRVTAFDLRTGNSVVVSGLPVHASPGIEFVTADGFGIRPSQAAVVAGTVTPDGRFTEQQAVDLGWSHFSPDRSRVVHERDGQLVVGPGAGTGPDVALGLPDHGEPVWFPVWESPETLLVQFDPEASNVALESGNGLDSRAESTWLLRCDAVDGSCEVAQRPGWGGGLSGPVYR